MHYSLPHQNPLPISQVEIEVMAYNSKALLLVVGFLLATALLGSSEVLTQEQLAQNNAVKEIHKGSIGYRALRPGRPVVTPRRPGLPYTPGCKGYPYRYCIPPPTNNEINSGKPHH